jgi:hypothetical protein
MTSWQFRGDVIAHVSDWPLWGSSPARLSGSVWAGSRLSRPLTSATQLRPHGVAQGRCIAFDLVIRVLMPSTQTEIGRRMSECRAEFR